MIADTTFLIDLMANDAATMEKANALLDANEPIFITSISIFELHVGITRSTMPAKERARVESAIGRQTPLPFDPSAARIAGELHGELLMKGTPIGVIDTMIAGIARTRNERVLTRNVKDYARAGIPVEKY